MRGPPPNRRECMRVVAVFRMMTAIEPAFRFEYERIGNVTEAWRRAPRRQIGVPLGHAHRRSACPPSVRLPAAEPPAAGHRLHSDRFDVPEFGGAFQRRHTFGRAQHLIGLGLHPSRRLRMLRHQTHHPRQRVRGGVFTCQQQNQDVADDLRSREGCRLAAASGNHRVQQTGARGGEMSRRTHRAVSTSS